MKIYIYPLLILFLFSCTAPQDLIKTKGHDDAFKISLRKLKNEKLKMREHYVKTLNKSLNHIIHRDLMNLTQLENSENTSHWHKALRVNDNLVNQISDASVHLSDSLYFWKDSLILRANNFCTEISPKFREIGLAELDQYETTGLKIHARKAYKNLKSSADYGPEPQPDLIPLMDFALEHSILNYYVEADPQFITDIRSWDVDDIFEEIEDESGRFLRVFYEDPMNNVDCHIEISLEFKNISINETSFQQNYQNTVQDGYETVTDTSGFQTQQPIFITVNAIVNTITLEKRGRFQADVDVYSKSPNCNLNSKRFFAELTNQIEIQEVEGDERAIPFGVLNNNREELLTDENMTTALVEDLYRQVVNYYF